MDNPTELTHKVNSAAIELKAAMETLYKDQEALVNVERLFLLNRTAFCRCITQLSPNAIQALSISGILYSLKQQGYLQIPA